MMTNLHFVALGTQPHIEFVRRVAAGARVVVHGAESFEDALSLVQSGYCDILVAEFPCEGIDGGELLTALRNHPDCATIFRIPDNRVVDAVRLMLEGAYSCIDKRMTDAEAQEAIDGVVQEVESRRSCRIVHNEAWRRTLVGESPEMQNVASVIQLVAQRRCTVVIAGETGTGKEMCARAIHAASERSQQPFVAINCSAIPEHLLEAELFGHTRGAFTGAINERKGRFEEAHNGTLFLDEIGDMAFDLQAKLLRVLQEREVQPLGSSKPVKVNVRIIAASNLDLLDRVRQGRFREDLYYRLNVVPIQMPALRNRRSDIGLLARHFVAKVCRLEGIEQKQIYNETLAKLASFDWPGNVRQLENMVERAVITSGTRSFLVPADFPIGRRTVSIDVRASLTTKITVPDHGIDFAQVVTGFEKNLLDQALSKSKGNKTLAADILGLKRSTLISKLRAFESHAA